MDREKIVQIRSKAITDIADVIRPLGVSSPEHQEAILEALCGCAASMFAVQNRLPIGAGVELADIATAALLGMDAWLAKYRANDN